MIKAIFFDLDSTLLNSQKKILPSTISALRQCKNSGIKLFIATARPPILDRMLNWGREEFDLFDGGIYCNGSCKKFEYENDYIFIKRNIVSYCINKVSEYENLNIALQMKDEIHAFNHPLSDLAYKAWGINKSDIKIITNDCKNQTVKILIYYENIVDSVTQLPKSLIDELKQYCAADAEFYVTDKEKVIQITAKTASKYNGIEAIRNKFNLKKSEIAVFGDDMNDIDMLSGYESSVAMGNADEKVKSSVRFVTKSNDNDGIAYALTKLLKVI